MKIIFLDIDGVLVTPRSWHDRRLLHAAADPKCVTALNRIIKETGADIVVSSTWRLGKSLADLRQIINSHFGVAGSVVGVTADTSVKPLASAMGSVKRNRESTWG